jgi:hypothetical protein
MALPRVGSLEVAEDADFQHRSWRVQRVGWIVMALVVLGALSGLFGAGPLSRAVKESAELSIEYARFARLQKPVRLTLRFPAQAAHNGEVRVWLDRRYVEKATLERVVPQPQHVETSPERLTYVFAVAGGGEGLAAATFHMEFDSFGLVEGRAGTGSRALSFRQLVYP